MPSRSGSSRSPGSRSRARTSATRASSRARCIPRQTCGPCANAAWSLAFSRSGTNRCGSTRRTGRGSQRRARRGRARGDRSSRRRARPPASRTGRRPRPPARAATTPRRRSPRAPAARRPPPLKVARQDVPEHVRDHPVGRLVPPKSRTAAFETTDGMIANVLRHVLSSDLPRGGSRRAAGARGERRRGVVRLKPAAAVVDRYATREVELGRARSVAASWSTSRSPLRTGARPSSSIRTDWSPTGRARSSRRRSRGPHVCLGMRLARLEAQVWVVRAMERLPRLRLDPNHDGTPTGLVFRKPAELRVLWSASAVVP